MSAAAVLSPSPSSTVSVIWHNERRVLEVPIVAGWTVEKLRLHLERWTQVAVRAKEKTATASITSLRCGNTELNEERGSDLVEYHSLGSSIFLHLSTSRCVDLTFVLHVHLMEGGLRVKSTTVEVKLTWDAESKKKEERFPLTQPSLSLLTGAAELLGMGSRPYQVHSGEQLLSEKTVAGVFASAAERREAAESEEVKKAAGELEFELRPFVGDSFIVLVKLLTGRTFTLQVTAPTPSRPSSGRCRPRRPSLLRSSG